MRVQTIRRAGFGAAFTLSLLFGARAAVADVGAGANGAEWCPGPEPTVMACIASCQNHGDMMSRYNKQTFECCCAGIY
jgi:hypothetical protein